MAIRSDHLDQEVQDSLRDINRRRSTKKAAMLIGLAVGLILMVGATVLMYSTNTGESMPGKIGNEVLE